jgi:hypothetical protein
VHLLLSLPTALTALAAPVWQKRKERQNAKHSSRFTRDLFHTFVLSAIESRMHSASIGDFLFILLTPSLLQKPKQWMARVISAAAVWPLMRQPWTA